MSCLPSDNNCRALPDLKSGSGSSETQRLPRRHISLENITPMINKWQHFEIQMLSLPAGRGDPRIHHQLDSSLGFGGSAGGAGTTFVIL
ncbi:hypothetical protein Tco_1057309 [Tanacetum coccineum]|uniref:Uncharacterized protein n=1 Tax=Tanacetum coccineum TaxID=301880 RepID=A0ABQ5H500_9ASTR